MFIYAFIQFSLAYKVHEMRTLMYFFFFFTTAHLLLGSLSVMY